MATDLLLDRATLERLTGTVQAKRMCDWLEARHWVFEPPARRGDIPKVAVVYYEARMTGRPMVAAQRRTEPSLDFLAEA
ncbi:hypothetical protein [Methylibium petroleiphilum]